MVDTTITAMEAAKGSEAQKRAFLQQCADMGNNDRVTAVGEFLHHAFGVRIPTRVVTFTWSRYDHNGDDTVQSRLPVQYRPQGVPPNLQLAVQKAGNERKRTVPAQVQGDYTLTVNGITLVFARGSKETTDFNVKLSRHVVNVEPETQVLKGRARQVDPYRDLVQYFFFWMHPANVDSPARFSPDAMTAAGVRIGMPEYWMRAHVVPTIRMGVRDRARSKVVQEDADTVHLSANISKADEPTLKSWARRTNIRITDYPTEKPLADIYRSHLFKVLTDRSGTQESTQNRNILKALMDRSEDHTLNVVRKAVKHQALVLDGGDWLVDKGGGLLPCDELVRYMVAPADEPVAVEWLATQLDRHRATDVIAMLDTMGTAAQNKELNGREVSTSIDDALKDAVATGKVVAIQHPEDRRKIWVNRRQEEICGWKGVSADQKLQSLRLWASSHSEAVVLATINAAADES